MRATSRFSETDEGSRSSQNPRVAQRRNRIGGNGGCAEAGADWATGLRGCLIWGIPAVALFVSPQRYRVIVWPVLLIFMGAACILNARRCGRVHCYVTAPFFLLLALLSLLYGAGVLPLGAHGWSTLSALFLIGSAVLTCVPEWFVGRYRKPSSARD